MGPLPAELRRNQNIDSAFYGASTMAGRPSNFDSDFSLPTHAGTRRAPFDDGFGVNQR